MLVDESQQRNAIAVGVDDRSPERSGDLPLASSKEFPA
jgi:hypothetical protein